MKFNISNASCNLQGRKCYKTHYILTSDILSQKLESNSFKYRLFKYAQYVRLHFVSNLKSQLIQGFNPTKHYLSSIIFLVFIVSQPKILSEILKGENVLGKPVLEIKLKKHL